MSDQIFNVKCGFFDAVNADRLYSADDMNRPYSRVVADGVFASPDGTPSSDLQVVSSGSGMNISVNPGQGIFGSKWFENENAIVITVPGNNSINPRKDSVIVQVDKRVSGRIGNIVYRTGTPAATPQEPDINTVANVIEFRVANIYVAPGASTITDQSITDLRGSEECPWVTGLIQQVDTSTLWRQYQAAYAAQYHLYQVEFQQYCAEQRQAWDDFLETLTEELSITTNIMMLSSNFTAQGTVTNIPINIPSFNSSTDVLLVYINGLLALPGVKYTLNANKTSIDLSHAISAGNSVYFVCLHAVIAADLESTVSMIQALNAQLAEFMSDSGWIDLTLEHGAVAFNSSTIPGVRSIGGKIYLRGAYKGVIATGTTIATLPVEFCPAKDFIFTTSAISGSSVSRTVVMKVQTDGQLVLMATSGTLTSSHMIPIDAHFLSANPAVSIIPDGDLENADEVRY